MIIKKYIVSDMKEALIRAKYELGTDAVIVSQRYVRSGKWYNFLRKKELEVTVAVESVKSESKDFDKGLQIQKEDLPLGISVGDSSMMEAIESDPFFKYSSLRIKHLLINYCKLHDKKDHHLSLEEKKEFFNIVLKETSFHKKVELSKINVLVGPTGVGKTTTIAKLAAQEQLVNKKKVGLITIDTYRIGAVEQLKTYAGIMSIPFEIVNELGEMIEKLQKLSHCDVVFIDTLGTSPKDSKKIEEIKNHLRTIEEKINTYLVFSIATDYETMLSIIEGYKSMNYDAFIITKLDEVSNIGNMWHFFENNLHPVQFLCNGQDVPDDIKVASLDNVFELFEENF